MSLAQTMYGSLEAPLEALRLVPAQDWSPSVIFDNEMRMMGRCVLREHGQLIPVICINFELTAWFILHLIEV